MRVVAVAWESITSTVIQNCFLKCSFGSADTVQIGEEQQDNNEWVELQECLNSFDDFINVDNLVSTFDEQVE